MLRKLLALTLLGVAAAAYAQPQPQPKPSGCSLHLKVTDEDGKALPKAFILIHGEHGSNQQFAPDKNGQMKTNLHAGMYDLFVSAMGFVPQAQILDLRSCKPLDLNLTLAIDAEHAENDKN